MTPPCATCNDRGMIPTEYGSQPCPMCDGWERRMKAPVPSYEGAHTRVVMRVEYSKKMDTLMYFDGDGRLLASMSPVGSHARVSDPSSTPPWEWFAVTIYLAIAAAAFLAVLVVFGGAA